MTDPNWLYSTTAQCAAAIVAIIGGFLVSRVVSLSADKSALRRRSAELAESVERYRRNISRVMESIKAEQERWEVERRKRLDYETKYPVNQVEIDRRRVLDDEHDAIEDGLNERYDQLRALRGAANVDRGIVEEGLLGAGDPVGVLLGVAVLAGFAMVSIVLPLALLAIRPVPSVWWVRAGTVFMFSCGLTAVLLFIVKSVRDLVVE